MRTTIAILIAALTGLVAAPFVFSDVAPDEVVLLRVVIAATIFTLSGLLVGWIAKHRWPIAAICAWFALLMGIVMLWGKLRSGGTPPYWSAIVAFLLGPMVASLFGGFFGSRLGGRGVRGAKSEGQSDAV